MANRIEASHDNTATPAMTSLRRPFRALLGPAIIFVVAGVISFGIIWWTHFQPLRQSPLNQTWASITLPDGKRLPQVNASTSDLPGEVPVWQMPTGNSTVHITVEIENAGSFPVRINRVQSPFQGWPAFGSARISFGPNEGGLNRYFRSFSLGGNQSKEVSLAIPMHCLTNSGSTVEPTRVLVSTSFFGVSHQVWVNIAPFVNAHRK